MGSNRASSPIKLYIVVHASQEVSAEGRLEERLIAECGPTDHRLSLIPTGETIHRVFLSFEHLVQSGNLEGLRERVRFVEQEFSEKLDIGFLDNRRAVLDNKHGEDRGRERSDDEIQFKGGGIVVFPWTNPAFLSDEAQNFFVMMRRMYRSQLRGLCMMRQ